MRYLSLLVLLLASVSLPAAPIDSNASGVYLGTDRVCRVELYRWAGAYNTISLRCLGFDGSQTQSLTTTYAPDPCLLPPPALIFDAWLLSDSPREYLFLREKRNDVVLDIVRGTDPVAVRNGAGLAESWYQLQPLTGPEPYVCSSAGPRIDPHALARFCREHPTVPACKG